MALMREGPFPSAFLLEDALLANKMSDFFIKLEEHTLENTAIQRQIKAQCSENRYTVPWTFSRG